MNVHFALSFLIYFCVLVIIGIFSYKKKTTETDFMLGGRSINYFVTAISAHASDMSSWLFMAFPAIIYLQGLPACWIAVGLILFMFLNWHFIAPKIRTSTEKLKALTFSQYFESRFNDNSGLLSLICALISIFFFTVYISAGIVSMGFIFENIFGINYLVGTISSVTIIIIYISIGGFTTIAWTDFFQGLFLLAVITIVPIMALSHFGWHDIVNASQEKNISLLMISTLSLQNISVIIITILSWGLGYFGQPHIITKFMGIKNPKEIYKSKYIGITWQTISLIAASFIGLIGIAYFPLLKNPELVFVEMTKDLFHPLIAGVILCAIIAAIISTIDAQILVLTSTITEDFYKKFFRKRAKSKEILFVSRICIIIVCVLALIISFNQNHTILTLALYAWSGLGASFGPLLIMSLYYKKTTRLSAFAGVLTGGIVAATWPSLNTLLLATKIPPIIPAFFTSLIIIYLTSNLIPSKKQTV